MLFYTESGQVATDTVVMTVIGGSRRRVASSSATAEQMGLDTKPLNLGMQTYYLGMSPATGVYFSQEYPIK
jgi:hypothetical protein